MLEFADYRTATCAKCGMKRHGDYGEVYYGNFENTLQYRPQRRKNKRNTEWARRVFICDQCVIDRALGILIPALGNLLLLIFAIVQNSINPSRLWGALLFISVTIGLILLPAFIEVFNTQETRDRMALSMTARYDHHNLMTRSQYREYQKTKRGLTRA